MSLDAKAILEQLELDTGASSHDPATTKAEMKKLLDLVFEKSLNGYVQDVDQHDYVLREFGKWLQHLYPRKRSYKMSDEEREARSQRMKAFHKKKKANAKRRAARAAKK